MQHIQLPSYKKEGKTEKEILHQLAVAVRTLVNNCEALAKYVASFCNLLVLSGPYLGILCPWAHEHFARPPPVSFWCFCVCVEIRHQLV
jgi:hypothetical protein